MKAKIAIPALVLVAVLAAGGVLAQASAQLLRDFFAQRRAQYRQRHRGAAGGDGDGDEDIDDDDAPIPTGDAVEIDPQRQP